jgi:hypothetical protein
MADDSQGMAFQFTMELMQGVLNRIERHGEKNAHVQLFQVAGATDDSTADMEVEPLGQLQAREFIGDRLKAGFRGLAGFSCIERDGTALFLRVEGFDTSDGRSVSARFALRKTRMGKLKAVGSSAEVDDFPTIPGVFPVDVEADS